MSVSIPVTPVPTFDPHGDPTSVHLRWKKWIRSFETYSAAAGCTDKKQKRQLLLHSAGPEVQDIFETLVNTGDDFDKANEKLTEYFTPLQNIPFNRHVFRQASQSDTETITQFVTRLRQLAVPCDFGGSIDDFIRDQVIDKCRSKSLRTKLLAEKTLTLAKVLEISSAVEASESRSASSTRLIVHSLLASRSLRNPPVNITENRRRKQVSRQVTRKPVQTNAQDVVKRDTLVRNAGARRILSALSVGKWDILHPCAAPRRSATLLIL